MAAPDPTSRIEVSPDGCCFAQLDWVWSTADQHTNGVALDLSAISPYKKRLLDSNGQLTGGHQALAIKVKKIHMKINGSMSVRVEHAGAVTDKYICFGESLGAASVVQEFDFTKSPNGGFSGPTSELVEDDTAFTAATEVTASQDSTVKLIGASSEKLAVGADFTTGILGYNDLASARDLSGYDGVGFWIRSSVALLGHDLSFQVDDTSALASPLEDLKIAEALVADKWTYIKRMFKAPSLLSAVASHGLYANRDFGAANLYIDGIRYLKADQPRVATVGDVVITTLGAASGDGFSLGVEFEFVWSPDNEHLISW